MDKEFKQIYQILLESSQKLKAPAILTALHSTPHTAAKVLPSLFSTQPVVKVEKLVIELEKLLELCKRDPFQGTHLLYQSIPTLCSLIFSNREQSWIANCYDDKDKESLLNLLETEGSFFNILKSLVEENTGLKFQVDFDKLPTCLIEALSNSQAPGSFLGPILSKLQLPNFNSGLFLNSLQFFLLSFLICIYNFKQQAIAPQAEKFALRIITNLSNSYCEIFLPYKEPSNELKLTCDFFNALINYLFLLPNIDASISDPLPPTEHFPSIISNNKLPHISHLKLLQQLPRYVAHPNSYSIPTLNNLINFIKTVILHWPNCEQYYLTLGIFQYVMFPWRVENSTVSLEDCEDYIHQFFILYTDIFRLYLNRSRHLPLGTKSATEIENKLVKSLKSTISEYLYNEFYSSLFAIESELIEKGDKYFNPCYTVDTPDEVSKLITQMEYNLHRYKAQPLITMQNPKSIPTLSKDELLQTIRDVKAIFSIDFEKSFYEPKESDSDLDDNLNSNEAGGRNMYIFWTITKPVVNDEQKHLELGTLIDELDRDMHSSTKTVYKYLIKFICSCIGDVLDRYKDYWESHWINFILLFFAILILI